jgi:hypothetical protein
LGIFHPHPSPSRNRQLALFPNTQRLRARRLMCMVYISINAHRET